MTIRRCGRRAEMLHTAGRFVIEEDNWRKVQQFYDDDYTCVYDSEAIEVLIHFSSKSSRVCCHARIYRHRNIRCQALQRFMNRLYRKIGTNEVVLIVS